MRKGIVFPWGFLGRNDKKVAVYKIVTPDGRIYIGRSRNVFKRLRDHALSRNPNAGLAASINANGWDAHSYELLHELPVDVSNEVLDNYEEIYLEQYRSVGFTILNDYSARQGKGRRISEGAKEKMKARKIGGKHSAEQIEKRRQSNIGKHSIPCKEETKKKISETLRNKFNRN